MNIALIFGGGVGTRMNSKSKPKQFLELNGKPIIIHAIEHFEVHSEIDAIAVVCVAGWINYLKKQLERFHITKVRWILEGGQTAQESTRNGLIAIYDDVKDEKESIVLIHDSVRPLINSTVISDNIDAVRKYGNAITVVPAIETIIKVDQNEILSDVLDRSVCRLARAPQSFYLRDIIEAYNRAMEEHNNAFIDSATLMRHYGTELHTVDGPAENIKITNPSDFYIFRAIVEARENSQIFGL